MLLKFVNEIEMLTSGVQTEEGEGGGKENCNRLKILYT